MSFVCTEIRNTRKGEKHHGKVVGYENSERRGEDKELRTRKKTESPERVIQSTRVGRKNSGNNQNPV